MNRLASAKYQLWCFKLVPARGKEKQYSDGEVAVSFKLRYVCSSNAYKLSTNGS